jgi:hypothetical protein
LNKFFVCAFNEYVQLMMPLEVLQSWSLYVFDPESKHMLVMDPTTTFYGEEVMREKHEAIAKKTLFGLVRCINENIPDWEVNASNWQIKYHAGAHFNCSRCVRKCMIFFKIWCYEGNG